MSTVVCVTGAGGFIGSWIVKYLLLEGYGVRGTLRDPDDRKNSHLKLLEGAEERLTLCKADVLDYNSLCTAFRGCNGVFHTASPVSNDPALVPSAVEGTKNVINAAADVGIRRIVFTSSFGAVHLNPRRSPDTVVDENCWSDLEFCKKTNNWYSYAKMVAELSAMKEAQKRGVHLLSVVPHLTVGPMLQPLLNGRPLLSVVPHLTVGPMLQPLLNASVYRVLTYVRGTKKEYPNAVMGVIDVRDVARAHVLVYENSAATGRYICIERVIHRSEFVEMLTEMFPEYPITSRCEDEVNPRVKPYKFSNQRLKDLGLQFTPIRQSLYETVRSLQNKGHLQHPKNYYSAL